MRATQRGEIDCVFHSRGFNTTPIFVSSLYPLLPAFRIEPGRVEKLCQTKPVTRLLQLEARVKLILLEMSVELFCCEGKILHDPRERNKRERKKGKKEEETFVREKSVLL